MSSGFYEILDPARRVGPVVFASPHSGRAYRPDFVARSELKDVRLRSSEDAFVDLLYSSAPKLGAPLIHCTAPRAWVDLNRAADELDPALIEGFYRSNLNPRVASGLGVIPRVVSGGRVIYRGKLPMTEIQTRLQQVWHPYHAALQGLLDDSHAQFGEAILIDCHSMPSEALRDLRGPKPDIVLGDRFGASASGSVVDQVEQAFTQAGFRVMRNMPFAGAYITQAYGRPSRAQHCVQVELNRALYLDEARIAPNAQFEPVRRALAEAVGQVISAFAGQGRLAAE